MIRMNAVPHFLTAAEKSNASVTPIMEEVDGVGECLELHTKRSRASLRNEIIREPWLIVLGPVRTVVLSRQVCAEVLECPGLGDVLEEIKDLAAKKRPRGRGRGWGIRHSLPCPESVEKTALRHAICVMKWCRKEWDDMKQ